MELEEKAEWYVANQLLHTPNMFDIMSREAIPDFFYKFMKQTYQDGYNQRVKEENKILEDDTKLKKNWPDNDMDSLSYWIGVGTVDALKPKDRNLFLEMLRTLYVDTAFRLLQAEGLVSGLERENKGLKDQIKAEKELNSDLTEENQKAQLQLGQIKALINEDTHCENIHTYISCELGLFKADESDCQCCSSKYCTKRLADPEI